MDQSVGICGATWFFGYYVNKYQSKQGMFTTIDDYLMHLVEADKVGKAVVFLHCLMRDGDPMK